MTPDADNAPLTDDDLAEIDEWLDDLEPGCDGWYIETRLVRALRDEVDRLRSIVTSAPSQATS